MSLSVVILAAGKGTRMQSNLPKVLHLINNKPMLLYVIDVAKTLNPDKIIVVIGYKKGGYKNLSTVPVWSTVTIPGFTRSIKRPPRVIRGRYRERNLKQKINFEAIIGGEENPRFTAPIATVTDNLENPATPVGEKTGKVNTDLENIRNSFQQQQEKLGQLSTQISKILSKNQFVN